MKTATKACGALAVLMALALTPVAMAETTPAPAPAGQTTAQPRAAAPASTQQGVSQQAQRATPSPKAAERRRRASYASCNRLSHSRGLRGGVRRRFLIRCKLGYVRPRTGQPTQPQPQPARQP